MRQEAGGAKERAYTKKLSAILDEADRNPKFSTQLISSSESEARGPCDGEAVDGGDGRGGQLAEALRSSDVDSVPGNEPSWQERAHWPPPVPCIRVMY